MPSDTTDSMFKNKTCMLLETKQSEYGPTSRLIYIDTKMMFEYLLDVLSLSFRVVAYPAKSSPRTTHNGPTRAMSFALESRDRPGGAVACAGKFGEHMDEHSAISFAQPVTTLETTNGAACPNGPSSRLVYGSVPEAVVKTSGPHRTPAFRIECSTTPEGPIARVTQIPQEFTKSSGDPGTCYETFANHDGSCPTAMVTRPNRKEESQKGWGFLETRVDSSGPRARVLAPPEGPSNVRHFTHLQVQSKDNGPSAKISQHPGDITKVIPNLRANQDGSLAANQCPCNYRSSSSSKHPTMPHPTERRNGLSPTSSELKYRVELLNGSRCKKGKSSGTSKNGLARCCPPVACIDQGASEFKIHPATCATKQSPSPCKRSKSPVPRFDPCCCLVRSCFKSPNRSRSEMHPLPGGTVFSQCPAPSLPEIAPVPLGPNRFRDYKPRPKTAAPRKTTASPPRPKWPPKVDGKSKKPAKSAGKKPKKKKKTNKKTGPSVEIVEAPGSSDDDKEKKSTTVSEETLYVECPAFASKAIQSVEVCNAPPYIKCPAFESKGNQASLICEETSYVKCPAFESKGNQTILPGEGSTYGECPAFKSTRNRSVPRFEEPIYIECPANKSTRNRSVPRFEEPTYVTCPGFASGKSSKTSTVYMPREDVLNVKYPEYFIRPKTLETSQVCRAGRHESKCNQCDDSNRESGLGTNYEQRQDRNARTLISSGRRRRRFTDDFNETTGRTYCVRA